MARAKGKQWLSGVRANPDHLFRIAYVECHSPEAAVALKEWLDAQYVFRPYMALSLLTRL